MFTGETGNTSADDPATTTVRVPKAASVEMVESINPQSCAADLLVCFSSELTIPGQFANLVIKLRRDASTLRKHAKIHNAKVFYAADGIHFAEVLDCDCTGGPSPGVPCLESRKSTVSKGHSNGQGLGHERDKHKQGHELTGYWEFTILATDNGRYNW